MFEKPQTRPRISAKVRAYGKARIDIAKRAVTRQDWEVLWKPAQNPFPFKWGQYWKQCIEYRVDDFASEVGFLIDVLGLPVLAFDPNYAMFTSPNGEFTFAVVQTPEGSYGTPVDAIRIQFMVDDIFATTEELVRRGIAFLQNPEPLSDGSAMNIATFQTPHGICMEIWGEAVLEGKPVVERKVDENEVLGTAEEETETIEAEEEIDEPYVQPTLVKQPKHSVEIDDLFEEIKSEHLPRPTFDPDLKGKPEIVDEEEAEEEFQEEIQYVDEPEANYPKYQPIPLRK